MKLLLLLLSLLVKNISKISCEMPMFCCQDQHLAPYYTDWGFGMLRDHLCVYVCGLPFPQWHSVYIFKTFLMLNVVLCSRTILAPCSLYCYYLDSVGIHERVSEIINSNV